MKEVFKFQAAQFPYHQNMLVYNKGRKKECIFPIDKDSEKLFQTHGEKFYAEGEWDKKTGKVLIDTILTQHPNW